MTRTRPEYRKPEVDRAGEILARAKTSSDQLEEAYKIMSNWRSAHSFPLNTFKIRLRRVSRAVDSKALVVQRLKRVPSIIAKLQRPQTMSMKLSQMQDIGGCRSVVSDVAKVRKLSKYYEERGRGRDLRHKKVNQKDYIEHPKADGYRSLHLIYKYKSDKSETYNGLLVEIQIRSVIQHAWATAVETVGLFTRQALKSNEGTSEWLDFFKLVSSAFAMLEGAPTVPGTPTDSAVLKAQISEKVTALNVYKKMKKWSEAIKVIEPKMKDLRFFLLELDVSDNKENLRITGYKAGSEFAATTRYLQIEKEQSGNKDKDVVLVVADSIEELKKAYPNYFIDTTQFLDFLTEYLSKK